MNNKTNLIDKYKDKATYISPGAISESFFNLETILDIIEDCKKHKIPVLGFEVYTITENSIEDMGYWYNYSDTYKKQGNWTKAKNEVLKWLGKPNIAFSWCIDENIAVEKD